MFKKLFLFALSVVVVDPSVMATNATLTSPAQSLKAWSVLMYGVPADAGRFTMKNIDDAMSGLCNNTTNAIVCCDLVTDYASLWQLSSKSLIQLDPITSSESHRARIVRLMQLLVTQYPAQQYALIINGGSAGYIDHIWDANAGDWCGHSEVRKGILFEPRDNTFLPLADFVTTLTNVSDVLGKKLDLFVADAGYMTGLELVTAVSDSVNVYVAPESRQYLAGFRYKALFEALAVSGASAIDIGMAIVTSAAAYYNQLAPAGVQCYATLDCNRVRATWNAFTTFMMELNSVLASRPALALDVYKVRVDIGLPHLACCYIDSAQWLSGVQSVISAQQNDNEVTNLLSVIDDLLGQINASVLSLAKGSGAGALSGLLLSYSQTNHGIFLVNQAGPWNQFVNGAVRSGVRA